MFLLVETLPLGNLDHPRRTAALAIALLFFIYGAHIYRQAIWTGILQLRLQSLVFATTFVVFPLLGFGVTKLANRHLDSGLVIGLMFVSLLPSRVWDWMFGTLYLPKKDATWRWGVNEEEYGPANPHNTLKGVYGEPFVAAGRSVSQALPRRTKSVTDEGR